MACSTSAQRPTLSVRVAPLDLQGVADACYDLEVHNDVGELVWSRGDRSATVAEGDDRAVCSRRYGNGPDGDIAYVGACDATDADPDDGGVALNAVTLWVDGIYGGDGADLGDWQDPCPGGCTLARSCAENEDRPVVFNLTVLREANQGFFDVAVDFEDVFCSAKVDCTDDLLHKDGLRAPTAVLALACTSGDERATTLYLDDLIITCDGGERYRIAPLGRGSVGGHTPGLFDVALYHDAEELPGLDKCFWNVAVGLDLEAIGGALGSDCHLETWATAAEAPFDEALGAFWTPPATAWPVIHFDVDLTDGDGALACGAHPLNGGDGVGTEYTDVGSEAQGGHGFGNALTCGGEPRAATPIPPLVIENEGLILGFGESAVIAASGGVGPYRYVAARGSFEGATYSAPAAGTGDDTITVSDARGAEAELVVIVYDPVLVIDPDGASVAVGGTQSFSVTGGYGAYVYSATSGTFAAGLYTAPATATSDTLRVEDALGNAVETTVTVFDPAPVPTQILPSSGVSTGGTTVTIIGSNFSSGAGASVTIGGAACTGASWTATTIVCTTPAGSEGPKDVVVRNASGVSGSLVNGFTYVGPESWAPYGATGTPPSSRTRFAWAWSGTELYVWGGMNASATPQSNGGRLAANNTWAAIPAAPFAATDPTAVWTGTQLVVFGGNPGSPPYATQQGAVYTPGGGWVSTATNGAPSARLHHSATWGGGVMTVWGGAAGGAPFNTGARYRPSDNTWLSMAAAPIAARESHSAVWTGSHVIIWGGSIGGGTTNTGAMYDPVGNTWTPISTVGAPSARFEHRAVWTGTQMIVWGGYRADLVQLATGGIYDPATDTWTALPTLNAPSGRYGPGLVWDGVRLIVWGGGNDGNTGAQWKPGNDYWTPTTGSGAPSGRNTMAIVWTGTRMLVWAATSRAAA